MDISKAKNGKCLGLFLLCRKVLKVSLAYISSLQRWSGTEPSDEYSDSSDIEIEPLVLEGHSTSSNILEKNDPEKHSPSFKLKFKKRKYDIAFQNTKECEEETEICRLVMLKDSTLKQKLYLPILCLLTLFSILLFMRWSVSLKRLLSYKRCNSLSEATHLMVFGTRNQKEIIKLSKSKPFNTQL